MPQFGVPPTPPFGAPPTPPFGAPPPFEGSPFAGMWGVLEPFQAALCGDSDVMQQLQNVSASTQAAFWEVVARVMSSGNRSALGAAIHNVVPTVRTWMTSELGDTGALAEENVNSLATALQTQMEPVLGQALTEQIVTFVRTALTDEVIVGLLRRVTGVFSRLESDGEESGWRQASRSGFDVHRNIECDSCGTGPIVGSRFRCLNRADYDLCSACMASETVDKTGLDFKECKYIWEALDEVANTPPPPLSPGDQSVNVAFLQKLLTDLGYLDASAYRRRVGLYGPRTRDAVSTFQREHGLENVVSSGSYDATTAASLSSIIESQVPPTAAAGPSGAQSGPESSASSAAPDQSVM